MSARPPKTDQPSDPAASGDDEWYLSFDCATKSFAFSLLRIRPPPADLPEKVRELIDACRAGPSALAAALGSAIDASTRACFVLAGGGAADLVPGVKDADIPTVRRVRAVKDYLEGAVASAIAGALGCPPADSPRLNVAIEFQMGPNAASRTVATVLLAHFARANVFLVGPAYKNRLWYPSRPEIRHCYYVEKYRTIYTANKNHARDLYFDHIAPAFGHIGGPVLSRIPKSLHKDFADSVVQVLGFRAFGDIENAAEKF